MKSSLVIRRATVGDATVIARHRVAMFSDMGSVPTSQLASSLLELSTSALVAELDKETYVGWLALDGTNQVVAGAGVHVKPQLPRISDDGTSVVTASLPLVVNLYTEPAWRHQGIARTLMATLMQWARTQGFDRLVLHASDAGRPLYVSLGFVPTNEMRWSPKTRPETS
jgi:GNAT superfamily N-acetyltransferase